jgi:CheY-like chemotaxis protein
MGYETDEACNGQEAVERIKQAMERDYDLILMDIQMPVMNGYEATRAIRALDAPLHDIPIIALTANAFEEDKKNARDAGMNSHIAKPINIEQLDAVLEQFLI